MDYRKFGNHILVRLDPGEEILAQLKVLARREDIRLAAVQGLGAVNDFTVGVFHTDSKVYDSRRFQGAYEIVSLTGTVDRMAEEFYAHLHLSAAGADNQVVGGHLNRAVISATSELVLTRIAGELDREKSPEVGLNLWTFR